MIFGLVADQEKVAAVRLLILFYVVLAVVRFARFCSRHAFVFLFAKTMPSPHVAETLRRVNDREFSYDEMCALYAAVKRRLVQDDLEITDQKYVDSIRESVVQTKRFHVVNERSLARLREAEETCRRLEEDARRVDARIVEYNVTVENTEKRCEASKQQADNAKHSFRAVQKEAAKVAEEVSAAERELRELEDRLRCLRTAVTDTDASTSALERDLKHDQNVVKALADAKTRVKTDEDVLRAEIADLEHSTAALVTQSRVCCSQMQEARQELEFHNSLYASFKTTADSRVRGMYKKWSSEIEEYQKWVNCFMANRRAMWNAGGIAASPRFLVPPPAVYPFVMTFNRNE